MRIEAALLTGGKSRRMGQDKARLLVDGEPQAERMVRLLAEAGIAVTVLGRSPVKGAVFLQDEGEFQGPLAALARFQPMADLVFVASCDLPLFEPSLVKALAERVGEHEAAAPFVDGFRQPLCALYRRATFAKIPAESSCAMSWLDRLDTVLVSQEELLDAGVSPDTTRGANTPEELGELLSRRV